MRSLHTSFYVYFFSLITTFVLCSLSVAAQKNWELVRDKDSIFIYKRDLANSSLKELKIVSRFTSNLTGFVAFITDIDAQPSYMYNCISARILKEVSAKELIFYQQIKAPWLLADRDGIYHQIIEQDSATHIITIHSKCLSTWLPKDKDFVRVPDMKSSWNITPNANGTISAEYDFYGDPGGSLPIWLVNMLIAEAPYKTQMNIRKLIGQDTYQKAKLDFIVN